MRVSLEIDSKHEEVLITIQCNEVDDDIKEIVDFIKAKKRPFIVGQQGTMQHILKPDEIHYFYAQANAVYAVTNDGAFKIKDKLYELEQFLPKHRFIRLSKSVIANLYELDHFEASFNGTLCVYFKSGVKEYVSRHYVKNIKEALQLNRRRTK